jgi:hypothetical protein
MSSTDHAWCSPALSTRADAAVRSYRRGIAALIAGAPHPEAALEEALSADPGFALARVGLAVAHFAHGERFAPPPVATLPMTRAERHHAEIVEALCRGDRDHATDLRREHLLEYPADLLVVWAPNLHPRSTR